MATETERFQSKFRRENRTTTAGRRRVFEDGAERESSRPSGVTVSSRSYGRSSNDRTLNDKTEITSVTQKLNNTHLKDDKDKDNEENEDLKPGKDEEDEEEEQAGTRTKTSKKAGAGSASRKRKDRKNLREKRRSTGVVIMPGQAVVATDEEERTVQENTARNMDGSSSEHSNDGAKIAGSDHELIEAYKQEIEEWKDKYAKATREIESLQKDLQRYKDENGALLRVVGSLSGPGRK